MLRFEDPFCQAGSEVDDANRAIAEGDANPVGVTVLSPDDLRHAHGPMLLQWRDVVERLAGLHSRPVPVQFRPMQRGPLPDQSKRCSRQCVTGHLLADQVERSLPALTLCVEVRRFVFAVVHPDCDSEV